MVVVILSRGYAHPRYASNPFEVAPQTRRPLARARTVRATTTYKAINHCATTILPLRDARRLQRKAPRGRSCNCQCRRPHHASSAFPPAIGHARTLFWEAPRGRTRNPEARGAARTALDRRRRSVSHCLRVARFLQLPKMRIDNPHGFIYDNQQWVRWRTTA